MSQADYALLTEEQKEIRFFSQKKRGYLRWIQKTKTPEHPYYDVKFLLSDDEVLSLLREAGITWDDVGRGKGKYQLGRYKDSGHYEIGNCRYISSDENREEQYTKTTYTFRGKQYAMIEDVQKDTGLSRYLVRKELGLSVGNSDGGRCIWKDGKKIPI